MLIYRQTPGRGLKHMSLLSDLLNWLYCNFTRVKRAERRFVFQGRRHCPWPGGQSDSVQLHHGRGGHGQADATQRHLWEHDGGGEQVTQVTMYILYSLLVIYNCICSGRPVAQCMDMGSDCPWVRRMQNIWAAPSRSPVYRLEMLSDTLSNISIPTGTRNRCDPTSQTPGE